jgi:hypothetical protein
MEEGIWILGKLNYLFTGHRGYKNKLSNIELE